MKVWGATRTFITDIAAENVTIAGRIGVDYPLKISDGSNDLRDLVMEKTNFRGVDLAFNTVGTSTSILESLEILRKGGTLVLMAVREDELGLPSLLLSGERTIRTSSNAMYSDFPKAIEMVWAGQVKVEPLITHRFALSDALNAFEVACNKNKTGAVKVIIDCQS